MNKRKKNKNKNDETNRWPNGRNDLRHKFNCFRLNFVCPNMRERYKQLRWHTNEQMSKEDDERKQNNSIKAQVHVRD